MLNKWDYRYPYFGLQKLHMGYGYGYPIYPQVSKHKDFMSLVNRLEKRMNNIEYNVSNISQDVVDELHALLEQFNEIDTIISVDDVQLIVESAIDNIEYPEYITIDAVKNEITRAINEIDLGLSALEVQAMITDSIDELDVGLSEMQVKTIIHESLAMIDTGLNYTQVQELITLTLANVDVGMSEDDVADLIQFHIQTIPIDYIQSELASLRSSIENLDESGADVDLTDIYSRLIVLESRVDKDTIYDDREIQAEIISMKNLIYDLIDNVGSGDGVDLTEVHSRLDELESKVDNDTIYDDGWIRTEIQSLNDFINTIEVGGVDLSEINSRLDELESKVDNDTIYDDEWIHTELHSLNELIDDIEVGEVNFTPIWSSIEDLQGQIDGLETGDVDLSEYVRHDQLSKEALTILEFTPNQSPQTYQIELSESTVDVYINLTGLHTDSLSLELDYSHLDTDEQTELEELFNHTLFNLSNINLLVHGDYVVLTSDVFGNRGYFYEGTYSMSIYDLGNLVYNFPLYTPGDSIPLELTFNMHHVDEYNTQQPSPEQSISIDHDMFVAWSFIDNKATDEFSNIISSSWTVKNNSEQISEMNNVVWNLEERMNDTVQFDAIVALENRIIELEGRLDNLVIPETQQQDVAIVRPWGPEVYDERPDVELAIYKGPWAPNESDTVNGDLWFDYDNGVYNVYTSDGWIVPGGSTQQTNMITLTEDENGQYQIPEDVDEESIALRLFKGASSPLAYIAQRGDLWLNISAGSYVKLYMLNHNAWTEISRVDSTRDVNVVHYYNEGYQNTPKNSIIIFTGPEEPTNTNVYDIASTPQLMSPKSGDMWHNDFTGEYSSYHNGTWTLL